MLRVIEVLQNETGRLTGEEARHTMLLTRRLTKCLAVTFKDSQGNMSLTHVDARTDLEFILSEAKNMQGRYKVDVFRLTGNQSRCAEIKRYIQDNLIKPKARSKFSEFQQKIISKQEGEEATESSDVTAGMFSTSTGVVLFGHDTTELELTEKQLEKYSIDMGRPQELTGKYISERLFETILTRTMRPPIVVYGKTGWLPMPTLSAEVKKILDYDPGKERKNTLSSSLSSTDLKKKYNDYLLNCARQSSCSEGESSLGNQYMCLIICGLVEKYKKAAEDRKDQKTEVSAGSPNLLGKAAWNSSNFNFNSSSSFSGVKKHKDIKESIPEKQEKESFCEGVRKFFTFLGY